MNSVSNNINKMSFQARRKPTLEEKAMYKAEKREYDREFVQSTKNAAIRGAKTGSLIGASFGAGLGAAAGATGGLVYLASKFKLLCQNAPRNSASYIAAKQAVNKYAKPLLAASTLGVALYGAFSGAIAGTIMGINYGAGANSIKNALQEKRTDNPYLQNRRNTGIMAGLGAALSLLSYKNIKFRLNNQNKLYDKTMTNIFKNLDLKKKMNPIAIPFRAVSANYKAEVQLLAEKLNFKNIKFSKPSINSIRTASQNLVKPKAIAKGAALIAPMALAAISWIGIGSILSAGTKAVGQKFQKPQE